MNEVVESKIEQARSIILNVYEGKEGMKQLLYVDQLLNDVEVELLREELEIDDPEGARKE